MDCSHRARRTIQSGFGIQLTDGFYQISRNLRRVPSDIAWAQDGKLASESADRGTLRIWDPATSQCISSLEGQRGPIDWSQDRRLASGSFAGLVKIWDPASVFSGIQTENLHRPEVISVVWSPDGSSLASSTSDGTVRVWDQNTGHTTVVKAQVRSNFNGLVAE